MCIRAAVATLLFVCGCGGANPPTSARGADAAVAADLGAANRPADLSSGGGGGDLAGAKAAADLAPTPDLAPMHVGDVVHAIAGVQVATLAGSAQAGSADGTGAGAQLDNPVGLALDGNGLLYVTEYDGNRIRSVDATGTTHTITTNGGMRTFACPFAIVVAGSGQLVVQTDCDPDGNKSASSGTLWRVDIASGVPTPAVQGLGRPRGLAYLDAQTIAVSDRTGETLSTLAPAATSLVFVAGARGAAGYADGSGAAARFDDPYGLARLADGRVLVADSENNRLRAVTAAGAVTTFAGGNDYGCVDGPADAARFYWPKALAVDGAGEVFVSDSGSHRIRRVGTDGVVMTVAGDGSAGFRDGDGAQARFYGQEGIAVTHDGKTVYVADGNDGDGTSYHRIRVITIP